LEDTIMIGNTDIIIANVGVDIGKNARPYRDHWSFFQQQSSQ